MRPNMPWHWRSAPALGLALAFLLLMLIFAPFNHFEFNPDEGNHLMMASLVARGHPQYQETWNDQPPIFTQILSYWVSVSGQSVASPRFFVLLISSFLLFAGYEIQRRIWGNLQALAGTILIALLPVYLKL